MARDGSSRCGARSDGCGPSFGESAPPRPPGFRLLPRSNNCSADGACRSGLLRPPRETRASARSATSRGRPTRRWTSTTTRCRPSSTSRPSSRRASRSRTCSTASCGSRTTTTTSLPRADPRGHQHRRPGRPCAGHRRLAVRPRRASGDRPLPREEYSGQEPQKRRPLERVSSRRSGCSSDDTRGIVSQRQGTGVVSHREERRRTG
mmetsp:Transcript_973/g.3886  ORF Transcript_973/g.3886 Transcript_973/m.3886 type:complete len:206 (+) Transcript_973:1171-1788(+)